MLLIMEPWDLLKGDVLCLRVKYHNEHEKKVSLNRHVHVHVCYCSIVIIIILLQVDGIEPRYIPIYYGVIGSPILFQTTATYGETVVRYIVLYTLVNTFVIIII